MPLRAISSHGRRQRTEGNAATDARRSHVYIEYALDFAQAGLYDEAINLLEGYAATQSAVYPMVHYALGYCHSRKGDTVKALEYYKKAEQDDHSYCFPNRIEEVLVLQDAMKENHKPAPKRPTPSATSGMPHGNTTMPSHVGRHRPPSPQRSPPYGATSRWLTTTNAMTRRRPWIHWRRLTASMKATPAS